MRDGFTNDALFHSSKSNEATLLENATCIEEAMPAWYVLYVQVNHEKQVQKRLQDSNINCYLPLMELWSKRRDRRKKIQAPLFPGYLFFHSFFDAQTFLHVLKTPAALTILKNSEGPLPVPGYQIENLMSLLDSKEPFCRYPYLKCGDWVRVVRGPLTGCVGILIRQKPKKARLIISIDLIKESVGVELDLEDIEPIELDCNQNGAI